MALVVALYWLCALAIGSYAAFELHLLILWRRSRKTLPIPKSLTDNLPSVTVQLPLYNEAAVVTELIDYTCGLKWPADKLEIQVLDDSTDDTTGIARRRVARWRAKGVDIDLIRREGREGYKAGALAHGLSKAKGEFVAIFDADFRPHPTFLKEAMPYLTEGVGFVQARWGYSNRQENIFTQVLGFHMDTHFTIEQGARGAALWMGFNGTAGIWRRRCIESAGGWEGDTLTEDLDLALRAQMKGWKGRYLDHIEVSSELPSTVSAIRTQQHRWMKGGGQVAAKLLKPIWASKAPLRIKAHATSQLLGNLLFAIVGLLVILTPFLMTLGGSDSPLVLWLAPPAVVMQLALLSIAAVYLSSSLTRAGSAGWPRFWVCLPSLLALSTGLSVHNGLAAASGLRAKPSPFMRTPKKGHQRAHTEIDAPPKHIWLEAALMIWSAGAFTWSIYLGNGIGALFTGVQCLGLSAIVVMTLLPWLNGNAQRPEDTDANRPQQA